MYRIQKELQIDDSINNSLQSLFEYFAHANKELYLVGGCVRDLLLGKTPKDYDLCTNATPGEIKALLENIRYCAWFEDSEGKAYPAGVTRYRFIDTGIKHGTITVHDFLEKKFYEITTYRVDGKYEDNRHPESVVFTPSLEEDLKRRDFTINSFAYNMIDENLVMLDKSYLKDLEYGIIRCVGEPTERFNEDALRMLRAIRFASQLNFVVHKDTYHAIEECHELIKNISKERVRDELTKILLSDNPQMIEFVVSTGLEDAFMNNTLHVIADMVNCDHQNPYHYTDVFHHTMDVVKKVPKDFDLRWAAFLHDIGKPVVKTLKPGTTDHYRYIGHPEASIDIANKAMEILKFSNASRDKILNFVKYHDEKLSTMKDRNFKKILVTIGVDNFLDFLKLREADALAHKLSKSTDFVIDAPSIIKDRFYKIISNKEPLTLADLAINGDDLIELGFKGKEIGDILNYLLDIVLDAPKANNKGTLLKRIVSYQKSYTVNAQDKPEIIVLSGIAGIGKSTWSKRYQEEHPDKKVLIVSSDETRLRLTGTYDPDFSDKKQEQAIWNNVMYQLESNIHDYDVLIVDACALVDSKRLWYWDKLHKYTKNFTLVLMPNNPDRAIAQNNLRERHVPEDVIRNMSVVFSKPGREVKKYFKIIQVEDNQL